MNQATAPQPEIDYSSLGVDTGLNSSQDNWEPPVRKFFGKRDVNGKMEKEPVYVHQKYPAMMYGMRDAKIRAIFVNNAEEEARAVKAGFADTPAAFGYVGAPSREQAEEIATKVRAAAAEVAAMQAKAAENASAREQERISAAMETQARIIASALKADQQGAKK